MSTSRSEAFGPLSAAAMILITARREGAQRLGVVPDDPPRGLGKVRHRKATTDGCGEFERIEALDLAHAGPCRGCETTARIGSVLDQGGNHAEDRQLVGLDRRIGHPDRRFLEIALGV